MRNLGVGALPVLDHRQLVGIITESNILDAFLELLGASRAGTRIIVPVSSIAEGVAQVLKTLAPTGAQLTGLTTVTDEGGPAVIVTADERDPSRPGAGPHERGVRPDTYQRPRRR
jgi:acetoin utilization protein AcuB